MINNLLLLIKHENEVAYDDLTTASYQSLEITCRFCLMTPSAISHLAEENGIHLKICPSFDVFNLVKLFEM